METTGGQTRTADEIDTLIGGGGGSFPDSIAPPLEYLMARPPSDFEWAIAPETAEATEHTESPMRRNHLPVAGLRRPMAAAGLSGEASGLVREFDVLQALVVQPRTLWEGMEAGPEGFEPFTCIVLEQPSKAIGPGLIEQPPLKEPRSNHRIDSTFERFASAIAAFDGGTDSAEISSHAVEGLVESITGVEIRVDHGPGRVAHRAATEEYRTQLS